MTQFDQWKCGEGAFDAERQAQERMYLMTADADMTE